MLTLASMRRLLEEHGKNMTGGNRYKFVFITFPITPCH